MEKDIENRLRILEEVRVNPDLKQKGLASRLGLGVGTVNRYIKQLSKKGLIKMKKTGQRQWRYNLTSKGLKEKAKLTKRYIKDSMELYRKTREKAKRILKRVKENHEEVFIAGNNELAEVCRLTALEMGVDVVELNQVSQQRDCPKLNVSGREFSLISRDNKAKTA